MGHSLSQKGVFLVFPVARGALPQSPAAFAHQHSAQGLAAQRRTETPQGRSGVRIETLVAPRPGTCMLLQFLAATVTLACGSRRLLPLSAPTPIPSRLRSAMLFSVFRLSVLALPSPQRPRTRLFAAALRAVPLRRILRKEGVLAAFQQASPTAGPPGLDAFRLFCCTMLTMMSRAQGRLFLPNGQVSEKS